MERSTSFPLGVRAFYKLFSSDKSVIIKQDNIGDLLLGYSAWEVLPVWLPKGNEESGIPPGLSTLYTMLPNRLPEPVPLVPGSTQLLEQVYFKVLQSWGDKPDKAVSISEWDEFYRAAPSSDDVQLYVRDNPDKFHIPFKGILFKGKNAYPIYLTLPHIYIFACAQAKLLNPNHMMLLQKRKEHLLFRLVYQVG